jgi:hypothetical protein
LNDFTDTRVTSETRGTNPLFQFFHRPGTKPELTFVTISVKVNSEVDTFSTIDCMMTLSVLFTCRYREVSILP